MTDLLHDIRYALRRMAARPLLTALAILSLALGIGVNSSIFTVVNAVLLNDPPVARPDEMVNVYTSSSDGFVHSASSALDYLDMRQEGDVFSGLMAARNYPLAYDDGERTELVLGEMVSGNFFDVIGVAPALGRGFSAAEDKIPGAPATVVLGHSFWQRRFAQDPDVIGSSIRLNGTVFEVVGVAPEDFPGSFPAFTMDVWIPLGASDQVAQNPFLERRGSRSLLLKGRLASGMTVEMAQAQMDTVASRLGEAYPDTNDERTITVVPTSEVVINPGFDGKLLGGASFLMVIVGLVLLIACTNLANLFLAQAAERRREIAVRLAIGAGRARLVRQLLTESLVVTLAGGLGSLLLASWVSRLLMVVQPPIPIPLALELNIDMRVLGFTMALAVLTGVVCGLAPALQASRPELVPALKNEGGALGKSYRRFGMRNLLVTAQVMLSTLLLIGAGLFVRSLMNAQAIDPGFELREGVAVTMMPQLGNHRSDEEIEIFYRQAVERVAAIDGVGSVALAEFLPLGLANQNRTVYLEGQDVPEEDDPPAIDMIAIGPGYFETMGISLLRGRDLSLNDGDGAPGAVIVNETMARTSWPGEDPLGKRLRFSDAPDAQVYSVVGVARDGKYMTLGEAPRPFLYTSYRQTGDFMLTLIAASSAEARTLAEMRRILGELDPHLPIFETKTLSEHFEIMLFIPRMGAGLLATMGLLGLLLASVGLYGVVAYSVARRTRELGVRMALGAGRDAVLRLVLGEGMVLVAIGAALGVGVAWFAARVLKSVLYGIGTHDPVTFTAVPLVLLAVALLAHLLPARQATGVDPLHALRHE